MRQKLASFAASSVFLVLTGCGFTPVYTDGPSGGATGSISINEIEGRAGHQLRKDLIILLKPGLPNVEGGHLSIDYEERVSQFPFEADGASSRTQVKSTARYLFLSDERTIEGEVEGVATFSAPQTPYANTAAQVNGKGRAAKIVARRLVNDLRLKLTSDENSDLVTLPES